ncbi:hypothetical protein GCM10028798_07280 [Humibacter antri]
MTDLHRRSAGLTRGRAVVAVVAGVIASVVLWYFGVDLGFACAIGFLAVAIGLAWAAYSGPSAVRWPFERPAPRPGTRSDVSRLAWGFQMRRGSVREPGFKAVRELAAVRLERFGLDLSTPGDREAIVALIGEPSYAALNPVHGILPSTGRLVGCLDALDALSGHGGARGTAEPRPAARRDRDATAEDPQASARRGH